LRQVHINPEDFNRIRQRDSVVVALASVIVLFVFTMTGNLSFAEGVVGSITIFALTVIYHLTVSATLRIEKKQDEAPVISNIIRNKPQGISRAMLDTLPLPVLLIGPGSKIESANPAAQTFLGPVIDGGHLSAIVRQPEVLEIVGDALKGNPSTPVEYSTLEPNERHVRAFASPIKMTDDSGDWWAMLVLADETPIKRADRMRADFLANASHELRTPLASLSGFIETLKGHAKDDEEMRERFLGIMQGQADRMARLIDDLLALSRVEVDEHVQPKGFVDMSGLARDVIDSLSPQIERRAVEVVAHIETPAMVIGERDQLVEVALNLIGNAVKYAPEGSVVSVSVEACLTRDQSERPELFLGEGSNRLTLATPKSETGSQFVVLRVQDSGEGIARRNLPRLSERFYRVDGQKSGAKEGTGLGLAIVKHIVNRHRGGFTVESKIGAGSVFSAFFPIASDTVK
jgi:two-component system phosphate regulon sensor histidine kinase PhoR